MRTAAFAALTGPDGVSVVEEPTSEPGDGEALVDVDACSINRHDLSILTGDSSRVSEGDLPFVSGLDVAGTVEAVGRGTLPTGIEPGDEVALFPLLTCGTCRCCREGPENLCEEFSLYHGGLAESAVVPADRLVRRRTAWTRSPPPRSRRHTSPPTACSASLT